jgi:excisionase family DNA binding protein
MEDRLYTTQETAEQLGVSDSHVRNMIRTGIAHPKQRIGNSWVFTIDEIERLRNRPKRSKKQ